MGLVANWMVLGATLACALDAGLRYGLGALLSLSGGHGPRAAVFDPYANNSNALGDLKLSSLAGMVRLGAGGRWEERGVGKEGRSGWWRNN